MDKETIVIKIRDNDPLCISVKRLTADSLLFRYLICDLKFTELEMDDFDPDTVFIFLTLLEDKTVDDIQDRHFRELHKLSVVFQVEWLVESCREWLVNKINGISSDVMEYDAALFLLEESRYILNKWELRKFVDLFVSKLASMDNTAFISEYTRDLDKLDSNQLDIMLKLGGSNTTLFLEIVLQNLSGKLFLDSSTKHLLDKMNLALCLEQNEALYDQMFETLSQMSQLTTNDLRFILKLKDSARIAYSRNTTISRNTTVIDEKEWEHLLRSCNTLEDIIERVEEKRINNMFDVVNLLTYVTRLNLPTTEEAEVFVNRLMNICQDNPLKKIYSLHIDSIISALKLSFRQEEVRFIQALLEKIKNNDKFSSCHDNVILSLAKDKAIKVECSTATVYKYPFEFKHPGTPAECNMSGKCGFILMYSEQEDYWKLELCRQDTDYTDTGLHFHEIVSAQEMYFYFRWTGTTQEGNTVSLPCGGLCHWYAVWLPRVNDLEIKQECIIYYNVSKYLVAKQD